MAPGVDRKLAEQVLAGMGINMQQFPAANHFASRVILASSNHQSGGKRFAIRLADGNQHLQSILEPIALPT